jgi:predicted transcriptional regulator
MSGSKPKIKVRTLDEIFKNISESSEETFEDTKGVIRNRISKNRQYNGKQSTKGQTTINKTYI